MRSLRHANKRLMNGLRLLKKLKSAEKKKITNDIKLTRNNTIEECNSRNKHASSKNKQ